MWPLGRICFYTAPHCCNPAFPLRLGSTQSPEKDNVLHCGGADQSECVLSDTNAPLLAYHSDHSAGSESGTFQRSNFQDKEKCNHRPEGGKRPEYRFMCVVDISANGNRRLIAGALL